MATRPSPLRGIVDATETILNARVAQREAEREQLQTEIENEIRDRQIDISQQQANTIAGQAALQVFQSLPTESVSNQTVLNSMAEFGLVEADAIAQIPEEIRNDFFKPEGFQEALEQLGISGLEGIDASNAVSLLTTGAAGNVQSAADVAVAEADVALRVATAVSGVFDGEGGDRAAASMGGVFQDGMGVPLSSEEAIFRGQQRVAYATLAQADAQHLDRLSFEQATATAAAMTEAFPDADALDVGRASQLQRIGIQMGRGDISVEDGTLQLQELIGDGTATQDRALLGMLTGSIMAGLDSNPTEALDRAFNIFKEIQNPALAVQLLNAYQAQALDKDPNAFTIGGTVDRRGRTEVTIGRGTGVADDPATLEDESWVALEADVLGQLGPYQGHIFRQARENEGDTTAMLEIMSQNGGAGAIAIAEGRQRGEDFGIGDEEFAALLDEIMRRNEAGELEITQNMGPSAPDGGPNPLLQQALEMRAASEDQAFQEVGGVRETGQGGFRGIIAQFGAAFDVAQFGSRASSILGQDIDREFALPAGAGFSPVARAAQDNDMSAVQTQMSEIEQRRRAMGDATDPETQAMFQRQIDIRERMLEQRLRRMRMRQNVAPPGRSVAEIPAATVRPEMQSEETPARDALIDIQSAADPDTTSVEAEVVFSAADTAVIDTVRAETTAAIDTVEAVQGARDSSTGTERPRRPLPPTVPISVEDTVALVVGTARHVAEAEARGDNFILPPAVISPAARDMSRASGNVSQYVMDRVAELDATGRLSPAANRLLAQSEMRLLNAEWDMNLELSKPDPDQQTIKDLTLLIAALSEQVINLNDVPASRGSGPR